MVNKVKIKSLNLDEFRNYDSLHLEFNSQQNIFIGNNGSGKTNILEAISFLSPGRGLRRTSYSDVTRIGSPMLFSACANIEGMEGSADILIKLESKDDKNVRRLKINDLNVRTIDELNNHLRVSWIIPAMDRIFSGPSVERRSLLDRMVLSFDPKHRRRMIDFDRLMRSRNRLISEEYFDTSWCNSIEIQMAKLGIDITISRIKMIKKLSSTMTEYIEKEHFPHIELNLSGFLDNKFDKYYLELEQEYANILLRNRKIDAIAGRTLIGPHRSDLIANYCDKHAKIDQASTGEQKIVLIGIFLSHAILIYNTTGFAPILLLDEIAAHLDEKRRNSLFQIITDIGSQTFITGTDKSIFSSINKSATFIYIANNKASYL
ncbi:DNA replication/repair protein RecF [Candidatus Liberibacter americanus]|uniref:DNA replication and repair protein RecF n=1 Tax=Candidatus Liberibacter americanus str. Sao Paulo TaxID=1261131 RepID=U6B6R4_9HYPH|nr:DNA replication/repair protein RecF [Candidatus Liberibacter americanus]AHA27566.1 Recombinational DNA repair ATPase [Candidatus Liberibacter americanus str. Sao Paulo]EMS36473.1 recombination protein F [Candidatus Liberibacter americanus PW_SP]